MVQGEETTKELLTVAALWTATWGTYWQSRKQKFRTHASSSFQVSKSRSSNFVTASQSKSVLGAPTAVGMKFGVTMEA